MKGYNGFSPEQRDKAQAWLRRQWDAGALERPTVCVACGQTQGIFDGHAEDYTEPFGPHLQAWPLCYLCHMMLHCRFGGGAEAFERYVRILEAGYRFPAFQKRNFDTVRRLLNSDEKAWGWAAQVRTGRRIPLLSMLLIEDAEQRAKRIAGYHQQAAQRVAA